MIKLTNVVVLRGNSGSGKSTIAEELRKQYKGSAMVVSQDLIRRNIIGVKDRPDNVKCFQQFYSEVYT